MISVKLKTFDIISHVCNIVTILISTVTVVTIDIKFVKKLNLWQCYMWDDTLCGILRF